MYNPLRLVGGGMGRKSKKKLVAVATGILAVIGGSILWGNAQGRVQDRTNSSSQTVGKVLQKKLKSLEPFLLEEHEKAQTSQMLAQIGKYAPHHARFAAVSLSMAGQEMQKALEETLALEEELRRSHPSRSESLLQAYTLVRIAFLYQLAGQRENERKAWEVVQARAGWNKAEGLDKNGPLLESFAHLEENFSCEGSRLRDYIRYRLIHL